MKSLLWDEYFEWKPLQQKCEKIYDYYRGKTDAINSMMMLLILPQNLQIE